MRRDQAGGATRRNGPVGASNRGFGSEHRSVGTAHRGIPRPAVPSFIARLAAREWIE